MSADLKKKSNQTLHKRRSGTSGGDATVAVCRRNNDYHLPPRKRRVIPSAANCSASGDDDTGRDMSMGNNSNDAIDHAQDPAGVGTVDDQDAAKEIAKGADIVEQADDDQDAAEEVAKNDETHEVVDGIIDGSDVLDNVADTCKLPGGSIERARTVAAVLKSAHESDVVPALSAEPVNSLGVVLAEIACTSPDIMLVRLAMTVRASPSRYNVVHTDGDSVLLQAFGDCHNVNVQLLSPANWQASSLIVAFVASFCRDAPETVYLAALAGGFAIVKPIPAFAN